MVMIRWDKRTSMANPLMKKYQQVKNDVELTPEKINLTNENAGA
jgi:hypothetical protein